MRKRIKLETIEHIQPANLPASMHFNNPMLAIVITRSEAAFMWGLAESTVDMAIAKGYVAARKAVTGGTILVLYSSMKGHYGKPKRDIVDELLHDVIPF